MPSRNEKNGILHTKNVLKLHWSDISISKKYSFKLLEGWCWIFVLNWMSNTYFAFHFLLWNYNCHAVIAAKSAHRYSKIVIDTLLQPEGVNSAHNPFTILSNQNLNWKKSFLNNLTLIKRKSNFLVFFLWPQLNFKKNSLSNLLENLSNH